MHIQENYIFFILKPLTYDFYVVNGVRVERGTESACVASVRHFVVDVQSIQVAYQIVYVRVLFLANSALVLAELLHVFL